MSENTGHLQRNHRALWCGVVMIIREDPSKVSHGVEPRCRVVSKIDPQLGNRRAIAEWISYNGVKEWFDGVEGDAVEVYAELIPGEANHLEIVERASKRDFFRHVPEVNPVSPSRALSASSTPAQSGLLQEH